ncbi:MAG TPA: helix-turn-helix transcriptional regulator [Alphaproteobacteria bacterium]|nr:helix-turn-helix transcriptional regulator [Alphaproteobacteria bacterium]
MLNEALRFIRVFHDLKQKEAADKLGISKSYLSEIESGDKNPTLQLIDSYSKVFDIPPSSILYFSENLNLKGAHEKARVLVTKKVINLMRFLEERDDDE